MKSSGRLSIFARGIRVGTFLVCFVSTLAPASPIHDAARKGDQARVIALLSQNSELVFSRDKFGNTPLHLAAKHNKPAIAALLLANGADVNARNTNAGATPLTLAMQSYQHKEMLELLLTDGAEVNIISDGITPLRIAVDCDLPDDVELLLANGAYPDNQALVQYAVLHDRIKILEILLDYGADPNAKDWTGHTPLYYAQQKAAALLRDHGGK